MNRYSYVSMSGQTYIIFYPLMTCPLLAVCHLESLRSSVIPRSFSQVFPGQMLSALQAPRLLDRLHDISYVLHQLGVTDLCILV